MVVQVASHLRARFIGRSRYLIKQSNSMCLSRCATISRYLDGRRSVSKMKGWELSFVLGKSSTRISSRKQLFYRLPNIPISSSR